MPITNYAPLIISLILLANQLLSMPLHTHNTQGKGYGTVVSDTCAVRPLYVLHALRQQLRCVSSICVTCLATAHEQSQEVQLDILCV
jgi:hypothetical protein